MTRLDGKRALETSWELLFRDKRDFLLAAMASQGSASFVDFGGKCGLSVADLQSAACQQSAIQCVSICACLAKGVFHHNTINMS